MEEPERQGLCRHDRGVGIVQQAIESGMVRVNHITPILGRMAAREPDASEEKTASFDVARQVRAIEPGSEWAKRFIRFLEEHGPVIDPTIALYELTLHPPGRVTEPGLARVTPELAGPLSSIGAPAFMEQTFDALFRKYVEVVGTLHKAGGPIVAGTDQVVPGHSLHRGLELYVQVGPTPMEAIRSATVVPARAMKHRRSKCAVSQGP